MVKKIVIALFALITFFQIPTAVIAEEPAQNGSAQVIAYYFHGSFRCPTCHNLEQYAKEAIEDNFKDELGKGILVFKAVNVEEKGNEHFVNDYQLYSKSLVLSLTRNGEEVRHKNLTKIWEHVRNKEKYINYVKNEISTFLGEIQ